MGMAFNGELLDLKINDIVDNLQDLSDKLNDLLPEDDRWKGKGEEYLKELLNRARWSMFDYADIKGVKLELENEEYYVNADGSKDYNRRISGKYKKSRTPAKIKHEKRFMTGEIQRKYSVPRGKDRNKPLEIDSNMKLDRSKPLAERMTEADENFITPAEFLGKIVNDESRNMKERIQAAEVSIAHYDPKLSTIDHNNNNSQQAPFNIFLAPVNTNTPLTDNLNISEVSKIDSSITKSIAETVKVDKVDD